MKKASIFFIIIINLTLSCKSSQSKTQLLTENNALKERIKRLEVTDSLNLEAALKLKKMNVVYRGFPNPIYISKPNTKSVIASASGLKKIDNNGNYILSPGSGDSVDIEIRSLLKNGDSKSEVKTLRIKDINAPYGTINNRGCNSKCELQFTKEEMTNSKIGAKTNDFLYGLDFRVTAFKIKMPHYRTIKIVGNKMNIRANDLFTLLRPNDSIQIFDIKLKIRGSSHYRLKGIPPILIKIVE
ncbi:GldM family protein [Winogradskyella sp.]|uniref:GldM family protein n=1 Tax=Winogradskyella sp. TaxID=1883156 RepID=UPI0025D0E511|nr:GldM family protein [Winogradskyella sp.]